ncbi:MAG: hypothetical protein PWP46_1272 [Fusobacteriaceae bacterium]|jgi:2-amino-4-hydroxy-6-hydroxymethyldihydropteridine diphosphokinase|nr:2-amino-4-hydroxy-6-hydroxymethyldihydropteridin epyrophosphokinase [Fusobacteriales bacterium]MDN5304388.1 hypothetical protein [Fusobacteriaceae bacterium]
MNSIVYLSLGSNLDNPIYNLIQAFEYISKLKNTKILKISDFYKTEPYGDIEQDNFINCCIKIETSLLPFELLKEINIIEEDKMKRKRDIKWGPRNIDIDIIFYDNLKIESEKLTIPHKEYKKRNFVLYPLLDIIDNKNKIIPFLKQAKGEIKKYNYPKKILISSCLLGNNCKYNGGNNYRYLYSKLLKFEFIKVCPETFGGLKIPRPPAEIQKNNKVIDKTGKDVTSNFINGAKETLNIAHKNNCEIAILKSKSPSCGYGKIYDGSFTGNLIKGNGITTDLLLKENFKIISS